MSGKSKLLSGRAQQDQAGSHLRELTVCTFAAVFTLVAVGLHLTGTYQFFGKPGAYKVTVGHCDAVRQAVVCSHRGGDGGMHMFEREVNRTHRALCFDIDVFPSSDGALFVGHPGSLKEKIPALFDDPRALVELTEAEIKKLTIPPLRKRGRRTFLHTDYIAPLDEVLTLLTQPKVKVELISWEIKNSPKVPPSDTMAALAAKLKQYKLHHKSAFLDIRIRRKQAKKVSRAVQIACVHRDPKLVARFQRNIDSGPCDLLMPYLPIHDDQIRTIVARTKKPVISWIVDHKRDLVKALRLGGKYLVSNHPLRIQKYVDEWAGECGDIRSETGQS